jgi:DnaJ family protein A protein 5
MNLCSQLTDRSKKKRKGTRLAPAVQHEDPVESSNGAKNAPAVQSLPTTPAEDDDAPSEISKRDKRRAKEAKKKAAEEAEHLARKEARKAGRKAQAAPDTLAEQNDKLRKDDGRSRNDEDFTTPRTKKGKGKQIRPQQLPDEFSEEKVARAVLAIKTNREKMLDKWGESWSGESQLLVVADWQIRGRLYLAFILLTTPARIPSQYPICKSYVLVLGSPFRIGVHRYS